MRAARGPGRRDDAGQTSVLIVGFTVVVMMLVAVVVDASAAYLQRQALDSLADGAALAAADGVQGEQVYLGGLDERAQIDPAAAERYVASYLDSLDAAGKYPGLGYSVDAAGDSVVVRVSAPLDLPLTPPGWASRPVITGTAASFVVVSD
ncbi:MAG: pilus assembly protein TadG-related protein [Nocardioidaceae bacterium]